MSSLPTVDTFTAGQTLTDTEMNKIRDSVNGGVVTGIGCRVYNTSNVSTTSGLAAVAFNSERYDTDTMHDTVTNNTRITIVSGGLYIVCGQVEFQSDASAGNARAHIVLNGTTTLAREDKGLRNGTITNLHVTTAWNFTAGDYVELQIASVNSITVNQTSNNSPEFWAHHA